MIDTRETPDPDAASHRLTRKRTRWRSVVFTAVLVVAGFAATGVLPVREYVERGDAVEAAQFELDRLKEENAALAGDIGALYTEQGVERLAREQYGFVRPGEIGFVAIPPADVEGSASSAPVEIPPVHAAYEDRSFLQRIWDFVTGNDLANDG